MSLTNPSTPTLFEDCLDLKWNSIPYIGHYV